MCSNVMNHVNPHSLSGAKVNHLNPHSQVNRLNPQSLSGAKVNHLNPHSQVFRANHKICSVFGVPFGSQMGANRGTFGSQDGLHSYP